MRGSHAAHGTVLTEHFPHTLDPSPGHASRTPGTAQATQPARHAEESQSGAALPHTTTGQTATASAPTASEGTTASVPAGGGTSTVADTPFDVPATRPESGHGDSMAGGQATTSPGREQRETALWRMRTTVRDAPGSLAAICTVLAGLGVDILTLQTHPLTEGTVDEFLLRAPLPVEAHHLTREITTAGGSNTWIERADAHDLVDTPTRVLALATRTALDSAELPLTIRRLLGRCTIRSRPAVSPSGQRRSDLPPVEGVLDGTVMRLRDASGGSITVERPYLPFTPTEFARVRALVELDAALGTRIPRGQDVLTLVEGAEITLRRAGPADLGAAKALHERCSARALRQRYHGPIGDAHRYLGHLLDPRFGQSLAARNRSGQMVALGHLLWDGDETEVALLVEDDWQGQGLGAQLLRRLVALARETGCRSVYAVTQSSNTGMVAAMRGLGLPLDYQMEQGTVVITARLEPTAAVLHCSGGSPSEGSAH
ncbi:GNAT family N-acetyltransferase [Streptomyces albipurpureus]|uniref:GNAT family N-acetyltransferase n=1 Tax=Streptomyces albipurpureus TaxID=2897419 RepID=UPI003CE55926